MGESEGVKKHSRCFMLSVYIYLYSLFAFASHPHEGKKKTPTALKMTSLYVGIILSCLKIELKLKKYAS